MGDHHRVFLKIRTILVSFRAAVTSVRATEEDQDMQVLRVEQARDRALDLLRDVAVTIEPEHDQELAQLAAQAQREIEHGPHPTG